MTAPNPRWKSVDPIIETFKAQVGMGEYGEPEDLAPLAVYLESDASRHMTGAVLVIDRATRSDEGRRGRPGGAVSSTLAGSRRCAASRRTAALRRGLEVQNPCVHLHRDRESAVDDHPGRRGLERAHVAIGK